MTKNDFDDEPKSHEEPESLSATGLFLRAFDSKPSGTPASSSVTPNEPLAAPSQPPSAQNQTGPRGTEPGEFTRMFEKLEPRVDARPARSAPEVPARSLEENHAVGSGGGPKQPPGQGPGDFTRIFAAGSALPLPPAKSANEMQQVSPPSANPPRGKGFSAPGVSDSASAEGSFTQLFKAAPAANQSPRPAPSVSPSPSISPTCAPAERDLPLRREPIVRAPQPPGFDENATPSVTSLLASLSSPEKISPGSPAVEPAPYRPAPVQNSAPPVRVPEQSGTNSGGVTRLIERLAEELPPPAKPKVTRVENSTPGEYTRMVSIPAFNDGGAGQPMSPTVAQPASAIPPVFAPLPKPVMPAVPTPPVATPAIKISPVNAPAIPPVPASARPIAPAPQAPKTKLEAMVPILLVVNTFLLIVILIVVVFALKSR